MNETCIENVKLLMPCIRKLNMQNASKTHKIQKSVHEMDELFTVYNIINFKIA